MHQCWELEKIFFFAECTQISLGSYSIKHNDMFANWRAVRGASERKTEALANSIQFQLCKLAASINPPSHRSIRRRRNEDMNA